MTRLNLRNLYHHQVKDPPSDHQTPSLLERLSIQEEVKALKISLLMRLSNKSKSWLNHSERVKSKRRKLSTRSVRSSPQNQKEMTNSNPNLSLGTLQSSMESKLSLLDRMNVDNVSLTLPSENERMNLIEEIKDMENLTGIMPKPQRQLTLRNYFKDYIRETNHFWEDMTLEKDQMTKMKRNQTMDLTNEDDRTRNKESMNLKCHGSITNNESENLIQTPVATRPETSSTYSKETLSPSKDGSDAHQLHQPVSQARNGTHLLKEKQSTSIRSSVLSTTSTALTKVSDVLEILKYNLEDQKQPRRLKRVASGPLPSISLSKQPRSSSPIDMTNSDNTATTSKNCSRPNQLISIQSYSNTTKLSDIKSDKVKTSCLPIEQNSRDIMKPLSLQTELELKERIAEVKRVRERVENLEKELTSAIDLMEQKDAVSTLINADIGTSVRDADLVDMEKWTAKLRRQCEELGRRPRYLRYNVYRDDEMMSRSCSEWTEIARPFPSVPTVEFSNILACRTINSHPELFTVNTPINVDNFEKLLVNHPNPPFVKSVVNGF